MLKYWMYDLKDFVFKRRNDRPVNIIDKLVMVEPGVMHVIYTHKNPVSIWNEDPVALFIYLTSPTTLRYSEFKRAVKSDLENTQAA